MPTTAEKRATFRKLHEAGCFVIPNPWDVGSARYLQHLGFKALASTSAGFAFAQGYADGAVPRDVMLAHLAELVAAADVPVNADFEGGYADEPKAWRKACGSASRPAWRGCRSRIRPATSATRSTISTSRWRASRRARGDRQGRRRRGVHRAHRRLHLVGRPDLDETIRRLQGLCGRRRRLPLCAGHPHPRADRGGGEGGGAQAGQPPDAGRARPHRGRDRRDGRAPHQRRRHARAGGLGALHPRRQRDRRATAGSTASPDVMPNAELNAFFREDMPRGARHDRRIASRIPSPASRSARRSIPRRRRVRDR